MRLMSQTKSAELGSLLHQLKDLEIDLSQFKTEMKSSIQLEKLKTLSCNILKTRSFHEVESRFGNKVEDSVLLNFSQAVISVKGAPNLDYRMLETYLNHTRYVM